MIAFGCLEDGDAVAPGVVAGQVIGFDGVPVAGALVRVEVLDGEGGAAWSGVATFADATGAFELDVGTPVSGTVVTAHLGDAAVRAAALADGQRVFVHPVTESLVRVILGVTSAGEPSWSDLGAADLRLLHDRVVDALPATMALRDEDTLDAWVRNEVGDLLAAQFWGTIDARRASLVLGVNETSAGPDFSALDPPPTGAFCNRRNFVLEGATFSFDIVETGGLCDCNDGNLGDAFDIAYVLRARGDAFTGSGDVHFPAQTTTTLEDEQELVLGPESLASGLEITRKIYVTPDDDVARYLEIVHNPTIQTATITLEVAGELGADADTVLLLAETGATVTVGDHYAATGQVFPLEPTVGFLWDGYGVDSADRLYFPPDSFGGFQYAWEDIELAPGETRVYAHFVLLTSWRDQVAVAARLAALLEAPPLTGLSAHEVESLVNFHTSSIANVVGAAGASAPGLLVSVANLATGTEQATVAGLDGSFAVLISDASSGHELLVRSLTGGERSVVVP